MVKTKKMPLSIVKERSNISESPGPGDVIRSWGRRAAAGRIPFAGQKKNGADRNRTGDLRRAKPALSQLSYSPSPLRDQLQSSAEVGMVGLSGFEPLTSRLSGVRSNQLSYRPNAAFFGQRSSVRQPKPTQRTEIKKSGSDTTSPICAP